jgi:hypothetical protein
MHRQSRNRLITEDVVQGVVAQRLVVVVVIDMILIIGQWSGELHHALLVTDQGSGADLRGVGIDAGE